MTCCTWLPSRGPSTAGTTWRSKLATEATSSLNSTGVRLDHRLSNKVSVWGRFVEAPSETGNRGSFQSYDLSVNNVSRNLSDSRMVTLVSTQAFTAHLIH